jgi:protocatechuate 3,4-dioxygenase beta subunit
MTKSLLMPAIISIMKTLINCIVFISLFHCLTSCSAQTNNDNRTQTGDKKKIVGGGCDGCELMFIGMPTNIPAVDTGAGWNEAGQKLMVTGTVFQSDGKTQAPNVVLYYWQTDNNGNYSVNEKTDRKVRNHGHIRGWVQSDKQGKYTIYTIRPASYPNSDNPAHIHWVVKEPDVTNEYYIDELHFQDDTLLQRYLRNNSFPDRGGTGIVKPIMKNNLQIVQRNIILGLNIPDYPKKRN